MVLNSPNLSINNQVFNWGSRTYIMGILNVTSDSFSGDGLLSQGNGEQDIIGDTIATARIFINSGVDILDIGGESTRPGSQQVGVEDELSRVIPIIEALMGKGLPVGSALAFMMAVTALSLPEFMILRRVMKPRLIATFALIVASGITVIGYLVNFLTATA